MKTTRRDYYKKEVKKQINAIEIRTAKLKRLFEDILEVEKSGSLYKKWAENIEPKIKIPIKAKIKIPIKAKIKIPVYGEKK